MKKIMKKLNKKGFTLAELLIVVAIIAVLVAISIPIFNTQLEKSREATDAANLRAAYAEVMTAALTDAEDDADGVRRTGSAGDYVWTKTVDAVQTQADWQNKSIENIGGLAIGSDIEAVIKGGSWTVKYDQKADEITITKTT